MVTLFASMIGFFGSIVPDIFRVINDRRDKKHELEIMDRQIRMQEKGMKSRLDEINLSADIAEAAILHKTFNSGIFIIDIINSSVRPILAYSFFALYVFIKYNQFVFLSDLHDLKAFIDIFWTIEDQAIFSGIISFYFGQRAMIKRFNGK
jgi:hypothetical protein